MKALLLEDWMTVSDKNTSFLKEKDRRMVLVGDIYGHPTTKDGSRIRTSPITAISGTRNPGILVFHTEAGSKFEVREEGMSEKFRLAFPNGFAALRDLAWGM